MNRAFETALAARFLWMDVVCLNGIGGFDKEVEVAVQAAYAAVRHLVLDAGQHYGANVPLLLRDVPELAAQYAQVYPEYELRELDYELERKQYMQDIADTYAEIDRELIDFWKSDCLDNDLL